MNLEDPRPHLAESEPDREDGLRLVSEGSASLPGASPETPRASLELLEQLPVALAVLDLEMRYVSVSSHFAHAVGRDVSDLAGRKHGDCIHHFPKGWEEIYESVLQTCKSVKGEEEYLAKPGAKPERLRWELHPWRAKGGPMTGVIFVIEVVTRRKQFEALARRSIENEAVTQLCDSIGIYLRNLFAILDGYAQEMVAAKTPGMAGTSTCPPTYGLQAGIGQGIKLSENLTALGRNRAMKPRLTDLRELLGDVVSSIQAAAPENIQVAFVPREGNWHCLVDPIQLKETVLALAENSIEAMPNGGNLTVSLALNNERHLCFCIADTGDGMSEEVMQQAIKPFFSTKSGGDVRGLGLSVAYGFITHSDGDLRIVSAPGAGTRVYVRLPFLDWSWKD